MKNYLKYHIYFIAIIAFLASCNKSKQAVNIDETQNSPETITITKAQFLDAKMALGAVTEQTFNEGIKTNGFIDVPPANRASVSTIMAGYIKTAPLLIGDEVKKGQLLLTIENPDFIEIQQNYLESFQQLNFLKTEYDRQKTLFDEKITSQKNYLKAESDYKTTLAKHNGLGQKLALMNLNLSKVKEGKFTSVIAIYSPISGSIANVDSSIGKFMNASEVLIELINDEHKHLELVIFEKDVLKVKEGQKIKFKLPESSSKLYDGEVHLIGKSIDEVNRTVKVHGHIDNEHESFLVGMFVEAEIFTNTIQKMALPVNAVLEADDNYYILVLKEQLNNEYLFEKVQVAIGSKNEESVEIIDTKGLLKNRQILINGAFLPVE